MHSACEECHIVYVARTYNYIAHKLAIAMHPVNEPANKIRMH